MKTLAIETGIEPEYENALQEAAWANGWNVESVQNIPFTNQFVTGEPNMGSPLPKELLENPNVWFHGSIQAAKRAQQATRWQVHAPWHDLRCSTYYPMLRERILQRDHLWSTVEGVRRDKDKLYSSDLVEDETLFFRPDGNDKLFTGGCISLSEFDTGYSLMTFYEPPPLSVIVVARPQRILAEARFLVVGGKLIAGSYYKTGGQTVRLEATSNLMEIAEDMLAFCLAKGFNPAPSWVLDLAQTKDGWFIIEVGATSCCGLYKCDMDAFVKALSELG